MTLKELSQLYYLKGEIEDCEQALEELRAKAESVSAYNYSGMPTSHKRESQIEKYIAKIDELKKIIASKRVECLCEQTELMRWISKIPDSLTRQIFMLRFVNCLSWAAVAHKIGGGNTEGSVKQQAYRHFKSTQQNTTGGTHEQ